MSGDTRRRLEDAGARPAPDPDAAFTDALEARLRAVAAGLPPAHEPPPQRRRIRPGRLAGAGVALVAAGLVVAVGVSVLGPRSAADAAPTLARPVNVEVALADGTVLEDPDGLILPEGAVVTVGEGGSARIGETTLQPGDVATMRGGHLEVDGPPVGAVASPDRTPRPTDRPVTPSPSTRPVVTPVPTRTPDRSPGSTAMPTEQPGATARTATSAPTATPATTVIRPRLRARLIDGPRIAVSWTATNRARSYVLVVTRSRSGPASDPVYPGSRVLGEFTAPPASPLRYRVPDGVVEVRLMVVALRKDGSVLRRSRVTTVTIPGPGDTSGSGSGVAPRPSTSPGPDPTPTPATTSASPAAPAPTVTTSP